MRKVWFEKEENIKKLVDMTNRGFEEFNADVGANYDGNERGPFGIHLHSWEAYEKAVEVSETVRGLLKEYRDKEKISPQMKFGKKSRRRLSVSVLDLRGDSVLLRMMSNLKATAKMQGRLHFGYAHSSMTKLMVRVREV